MAENLWRGRVSTKWRPDLGSAYPKTPVTTFCLTIFIRFEFPLMFLVQFLRYVSLLQEGTTAELPALDNSPDPPLSALWYIEASNGQRQHASNACHDNWKFCFILQLYFVSDTDRRTHRDLLLWHHLHVSVYWLIYWRSHWIRLFSASIQTAQYY